jgi:SAM-dependent methyltransferase
MMNMYQTEWLGIRFSDFAQPDHENIADAKFYEGFYREFFRRNDSKEQLEPAYLKVKREAARFISERFPDKDAKILAIGCGLGIIEMNLLGEGYRNIYITEVSDVPLRWIGKVLDRQRIFVGYFPECIPPGLDFDAIYLCGVDYCFRQNEWTEFLATIKHKLREGGRCMVISGSYEAEGFFARTILQVKSGVKQFLNVLKLRPLGQFWGYTRTRDEYGSSLRGAGYFEIVDGFMVNGAYWIEGYKPALAIRLDNAYGQ